MDNVGLSQNEYDQIISIITNLKRKAKHDALAVDEIAFSEMLHNLITNTKHDYNYDLFYHRRLDFLIQNLKVLNLKNGDYIAFGFNYNGGEPNEIIVSNITEKMDYTFIVHFMYGHHSLSESIKIENVLAIGDPEGTVGIKGWNGKFEIIKSTKLLLDSLKQE